MMKKINKKLKKRQNSGLVHWSFITRIFWKTPSNYIPILLYLLFLVTILIIIPKVLLYPPLFIWNNQQFNIQIFNLFFIALICGGIAAHIFCLKNNDVTDLIVLSKPLTRKRIIFNKIVFCFLVITIFTILIIGIGAMIPCIFGWYDPINNVMGISKDNYFSLLFSLFLGNLICSLFFIAFAIMIGIHHGVTFTMTISLLIATIFNFFNFIFPFISTKSNTYIQETYGTTINSFSINTMEQYRNFDPTKKNETINVCSLWSNEDNANPYLIQQEAIRHSNEQTFNYFDIGYQMSQLFHAFSSYKSLTEAGKKSAFGSNFNTYKYNINENNIFQTSNTPLVFYDISKGQGMQFANVFLLGINISNAETRKILETYDIDCNFISLISKNQQVMFFNKYEIDEILKKFGHCYLQLNDIKQQYVNNEEMFTTLHELANKIIDKIILHWGDQPIRSDVEFNWDDIIWQELSKSGLSIWGEKYTNLRKFIFGNETNGIGEISDNTRLLTIGQFQLAFFINLINRQYEAIKNFDNTFTFPFTSEQIIKYFNEQKDEEYIVNILLLNLIKNGISLLDPKAITTNKQEQYYLHLPCQALYFCESINQMHEYDTVPFFNINDLIIAWSTISFLFSTISLCIYWRIDFK